MKKIKITIIKIWKLMMNFIYFFLDFIFSIADGENMETIIFKFLNLCYIMNK